MTFSSLLILEHPFLHKSGMENPIITIAVKYMLTRGGVLTMVELVLLIATIEMQDDNITRRRKEWS